MEKEIFHAIGRQRVRPVKLTLSRALRRRQTMAERVFWQAVRARRLDGFKFRRQQVVAGLVVDFYCPACRLAVEIDGGVHTGREEEDREREKALAALGIRVVRFTNEEVLGKMDEVKERLRKDLT